MKIVQVHNRSKRGGGADVVFDATVDLLTRNGVHVSVLERSSKELSSGLTGRLTALFAGIYSPSAIRVMNNIMKEERPDLIHVHELYPLLPWILKACGQAAMPLVMTCHNYRLVCPTYNSFTGGRVCERCHGGHEYWCIIKNCRSNLFESSAFAIHHMVGRKKRLYKNHVTLFITPSEFVKRRLVNESFREEQIEVLPNLLRFVNSGIDSQAGYYVAYSGRLSSEKGITTLFAAASKLPHILFHITGDQSHVTCDFARIPKNIRFVGWLNELQIADFYRNALFVVVPSIWFEVFGLVAIEAMSYGLPVIASRIGALEEIIDDGITGLHFEAGNTTDLVSKIELLWDNPNLCRQLSVAALRKAHRCYNQDLHYKRLMVIYEKAIEMKSDGKI